MLCIVKGNGQTMTSAIETLFQAQQTNVIFDKCTRYMVQESTKTDSSTEYRQYRQFVVLTVLQRKFTSKG